MNALNNAELADNIPGIIERHLALLAMVASDTKSEGGPVTQQFVHDVANDGAMLAAWLSAHNAAGNHAAG